MKTNELIKGDDMTDSETRDCIKTFIANLRYALRNRETVYIGGGEFGPEELVVLIRTIEATT